MVTELLGIAGLLTLATALQITARAFHLRSVGKVILKVATANDTDAEGAARSIAVVLGRPADAPTSDESARPHQRDGLSDHTPRRFAWIKQRTLDVVRRAPSPG